MVGITRALGVPTYILSIAASVLALAGCSAGDPGDLQRRVSPGPDTATQQPPPGSAETPGATDATGGAFPYERSHVELLPFQVRLAKVARVLGVPTADPVLAALRERRRELGDYDFASGVNADTSWSAARMGLWVRSLQPACASPAMRARFDALPEKLSELVLAAYGRRATHADRAAVDAALTGLGNAATAKERYELVCLAILSSAEFVSR